MIVELKKFFTLGWRDRLLLAEAACALGAARLAVLVMPFRWIAPRLGETTSRSAGDGIADPELPRRIGWAVAVASRYLPGTSRCLAEAIAGKVLLRRRGVPSTLYLGVARDGEATLEAHAWLSCGEEILTGGRAARDFSVIRSFAD